MTAVLAFRAGLYRWAFDRNNATGFAVRVENWIAVLIVVNLVALLLEEVQPIYVGNEHFFHGFDIFSVVVFTLEYVGRLFVAPEDPEFSGSRFPRLAYIRSPFALVDLAAILPFYLSVFLTVDLRALRTLRLLRILKLFRVLGPAIQEFRLENRGRTFRQQVYALLNPTDHGGQLHHYLDLFIVFWVTVSVLSVILESVAVVEAQFHVQLVVLDCVAVMIFSIEYALRIYSCVEDPRLKGAIIGRVRYVKSPIALIDFFAILPFYLELFLGEMLDLRFLRIFRLSRLLKLTRYTGATGTLFKALRREWPTIAAATFIMMLFVVLTASMGYLFEHDAQPDKFENIPQAIYWAVVTLASVGYGDISPVTPAGRFMTIVMSLAGIGLFAVPAAILTSAFNEQLRKDREALHNELYKYFDDGELDAQELEKIYAHANRLRIPLEDVEVLIERAQQERKSSGDGRLPLEMMTSNADIAFEKFREGVGQLRQIVAVSNARDVARLFEQTDKASADERAVWQLLKKQ